MPATQTISASGIQKTYVDTPRNADARYYRKRWLCTTVQQGTSYQLSVLGVSRKTGTTTLHEMATSGPNILHSPTQVKWCYRNASRCCTTTIASGYGHYPPGPGRIAGGGWYGGGGGPGRMASSCCCCWCCNIPCCCCCNTPCCASHVLCCCGVHCCPGNAPITAACCGTPYALAPPLVAMPY